jgi:hypothetical protein
MAIIGGGVLAAETNSRAEKLYGELTQGRGRRDQVIASIENEDADILILLQAMLSAAEQLARIAPAIQAIIDRRLHREQIESQRSLRETMENVSATLRVVEKNQKDLELANLALSRSANRLGLMQVVVAVIFGTVGLAQACGR